MPTGRYIAYTQSPTGRQRVAQTHNQHDAWNLAMVATKQAAHACPGLAHAAVLYDNVAGVLLATMPYKPRVS